MKRWEFVPRASRAQVQFLIAELRAKNLGIAGPAWASWTYSRGRKEARLRFSDCDIGAAADSRARETRVPRGLQLKTRELLLPLTRNWSPTVASAALLKRIDSRRKRRCGQEDCGLKEASWGQHKNIRTRQREGIDSQPNGRSTMGMKKIL